MTGHLTKPIYAIDPAGRPPDLVPADLNAMRRKKKTLNATQLLTVAECRVVRLHLQADIQRGEGGTFIKYDQKTGRKVYDEKSEAIAVEAMEKILSYLTYVPPRSTNR
jgi:hypothetical protein